MPASLAFAAVVAPASIFPSMASGPNPWPCVVLSDHQWRSEQGHLCGAFVFEQDGLLAGLDLWSIDGQSAQVAMPPLERLVPFRAASQVQ